MMPATTSMRFMGVKIEKVQRLGTRQKAVSRFRHAHPAPEKARSQGLHPAHPRTERRTLPFRKPHRRRRIAQAQGRKRSQVHGQLREPLRCRSQDTVHPAVQGLGRAWGPLKNFYSTNFTLSAIWRKADIFGVLFRKSSSLATISANEPLFTRSLPRASR